MALEPEIRGATPGTSVEDYIIENMAPGYCPINFLATFRTFSGRKAGLAPMEFAKTQRGINGLYLTVGDANLATQGF